MTNKNDGMFQLGDKEFTIPPRGIGYTGDWKETHIEPLIDLIYGLENIDFSVSDAQDAVSGKDFKQFLNDFRPMFDKVVNIDEVIALAVIDWIDPSDEDDNHLRYHTFPSDFVDPLEWLIGKIYPLERVMRLFNGTPPATVTQLNSHKRNGGGRSSKRGGKN